MAKPSMLPEGMQLIGDIQGDEDFIVWGTIEGEVAVSGSLLIEATGTVRGNVQGRDVIVRGVVVGDARADASIRVDEGGRMVGDVHAPRVNIVKGARFRGHVHMTGAAPGLAPQALQAQRRAPTLASVRSAAQPGPTPEQLAANRTPTIPGSVRAVPRAETASGTLSAEPGPRRPPSPRMPVLRRRRASRRDA